MGQVYRKPEVTSVFYEDTFALDNLPQHKQPVGQTGNFAILGVHMLIKTSSTVNGSLEGASIAEQGRGVWCTSQNLSQVKKCTLSQLSSPRKHTRVTYWKQAQPIWHKLMMSPLQCPTV